MPGAQIVLIIYHEFIQYFVSNAYPSVFIRLVTNSKPKCNWLSCSIVFVGRIANTGSLRAMQRRGQALLWHNALFVRFENRFDRLGAFQKTQSCNRMQVAREQT
jgi:hypothetical protein